VVGRFFKYVTWYQNSGISSPTKSNLASEVAEGYTNLSFNWPRMNWAASDLSREWKRFYQHCEFTGGGPLSKCTEKEKIGNLMSFIGDKD